MPQRPNILFLMTDHTNAQALRPGSPCRTPNLDQLAFDGVRFDRCYTTNAICSPARASLMTGTYPSTHGVWDCTHTQRAGWVRLDGRLAHWAQRLADAGYQTGYFGKWHADHTGRPENYGWQDCDTGCSSLRLEQTAGTEVRVATPGYREYLLAATGQDAGPPPRHPAFDKGIEFIRRHAHDGQPFCCFVSTAEPHDAYVPPKRFLDLYDVDTLPLSPTLRDEPAGKPEIVRRMRALWQSLTDADWRRISAAYWAVISFLDSEVGRILDELKKTGAYENTIVVFTADHGDMLGGHGLATKGVGTPYEEVYNIPLILRVPGIPGRDAEEQTAAAPDEQAATSLVDLGPTLLDLCGLDPLPDAQGRSLRPVLERSAEPADWLDAYAEFYGQRFVYTQRITWHGDWKYIFSPGGIDELYHIDIADDPHERRNLAADPEHRATLLDMTSRMWRKMKSIGDDSLFNTHYATLRTAPVGPLAENDGKENSA